MYVNNTNVYQPCVKIIEKDNREEKRKDLGRTYVPFPRKMKYEAATKYRTYNLYNKEGNKRKSREEEREKDRCREKERERQRGRKRNSTSRNYYEIAKN